MGNGQKQIPPLGAEFIYIAFIIGWFSSNALMNLIVALFSAPSDYSLFCELSDVIIFPFGFFILLLLFNKKRGFKWLFAIFAVIISSRVIFSLINEITLKTVLFLSCFEIVLTSLINFLFRSKRSKETLVFPCTTSLANTLHRCSTAFSSRKQFYPLLEINGALILIFYRIMIIFANSYSYIYPYALSFLMNHQLIICIMAAIAILLTLLCVLDIFLFFKRRVAFIAFYSMAEIFMAIFYILHIIFRITRTFVMFSWIEISVSIGALLYIFCSKRVRNTFLVTKLTESIYKL